MTTVFASDCQWCGQQRIIKRGLKVCLHCDDSCLGPRACDVCRRVEDHRGDGRGPRTRYSK